MGTQLKNCTFSDLVVKQSNGSYDFDASIGLATGCALYVGCGYTRYEGDDYSSAHWVKIEPTGITVGSNSEENNSTAITIDSSGISGPQSGGMRLDGISEITTTTINLNGMTYIDPDDSTQTNMSKIIINVNGCGYAVMGSGPFLISNVNS